VTQSSNSKEKEKRKVFHDHGKDSLELAISIGKAQEDKALLKAGKHHQPQAGQPRVRSERTHTQRKSGTKQKTKLEEVKATIANQRARLKRVKAKLRKERPVCAVNQISGPSGNAQDRAPRKRVSFV